MPEDKKPNETQEQFNLRLSVMQKSFELLTGAFSLVAALAWNDAIQTLFVKLFGPQSGIFAKFLYAMIVTGIVVWVGYKMSSIQKKLAKKPSNQK